MAFAFISYHTAEKVIACHDLSWLQWFVTQGAGKEHRGDVGIWKALTQHVISSWPSDIVLTHWGRDKMAAIFQTTLSNWFSWTKMYKFRLKFHWSLFLGDVQRDWQWGLKNGGNSHWSREPIKQWGARQCQSVFIPTNHKRVMPANWRPCLISHWQSYCHQARSV